MALPQDVPAQQEAIIRLIRR